MTDDLQFAEDMVTALQDALLAHAQGNPLRKSFAIAGRSMEFGDMDAVQNALVFWQAQVRSLRAAEQLAAGIAPAGRLMARF